MRILAIGIGTDTQDILLLDTADSFHNNVKMVMPSATEIAARRIRRATLEGRPLLLTGVTMGGGPCHWALDAHLKQGLRAYATESAALTFDDDLAVVRAKGVTVLSEDEATGLRGAERVEMRDLDLVAIRSALAAFEAPTTFDGLAIGCLDHGTPPPGISERNFRFEHVRRVLRHEPDLHAFALAPEDVPDYLTRARAMLASRDVDVPTVVVDTGVAAALSALQVPEVRERDEQFILNVGATHALGLHTSGTRIHALFEHHTDMLSGDEIEALSERFLRGDLTLDEVLLHQGHGVCYLDQARPDNPAVVVTGPRRTKLRGRYFPVADAGPHADSMIAGCLGLIEGFVARYPDTREEVATALGLSVLVR